MTLTYQQKSKSIKHTACQTEIIRHTGTRSFSSRESSSLGFTRKEKCNLIHRASVRSRICLHSYDTNELVSTRVSLDHSSNKSVFPYNDVVSNLEVVGRLLPLVELL